ncbi:MAG: CDP-alcohol phosphatidyltransferase family protein [Candidatus Lokiarchaeota archaeon]|nr:CDP-alcohol phosphatidyltransferase family protein [Candidatus Lokiarchaeota archaeon]
MTFDEYYGKWLEDHAYNHGKIVKGWLKISYHTCRCIFLPLKFTPLRIDFLSLALSLLIVVIFSFFPYLNATGLFLSAFLIIFLIITIAMMDNIDGALARLKNTKSPKGSYQDLIFDRINDGIILIAPIFSGYTEMSSVLFLLFSVSLFENLRSIHISAGIPIFSTVAERHARIVFQVGYIIISSCGFYLISLGYSVQITVGGKPIHFWPNLDILYICLGLMSIIGTLQIAFKIGKIQKPPLKLSHDDISIVNTTEDGLTIRNNGINKKQFEEGFNFIVSSMFLHQYNLLFKRLSYFQAKTLNRILKKPKNLFIAALITNFICFIVLFIKITLNSFNHLIEISCIVFLLVYFFILSLNSRKMLYYSNYNKQFSIRALIFFQVLDLITQITLLSIFALTISNNIVQIFVTFCLVVLLSHTINIINQRRRVREKKGYFSDYLLNAVNLFLLLFGFFFSFSTIINFYYFMAWTIFLTFTLINHIYNANSSL